MSGETGGGLAAHLGELVRGQDCWACPCGAVLAVYLDDARSRRWAHIAEVHDRILAVRLADANARLAAVGVLAESWDPPEWKPSMSSGMTLKRCADQLRAALRPDPREFSKEGT